MTHALPVLETQETNSVFHITIVFPASYTKDSRQKPVEVRMEDTEGNLQKVSLSNKDRADDLKTESIGKQ